MSNKPPAKTATGIPKPKVAAKRKPHAPAPLAAFTQPQSAFARRTELMTVAAMAVAESRAIGLGLDWSVIQKYVMRFGPEIIDLAESLVEKGFTAEFVYEAIEKLTPDILAVLRELLTGEPSVDAAADGSQQFLFPGSSILIRLAAKKIVAALKEKLPPNLRALVDQYADDLIEIIVGVIG